jgi:energy-coupling factor transporter ATP-binding protein EcfA2
MLVGGSIAHLAPMLDFDFQPYLSAIVDRYSLQRDLYTPTDALLPLEARSVECEEAGQAKRVEQFPVLAGLRQYALGDKREHVLLAGRPGSGKSTALRQLAGALAEAALIPQPLLPGGEGEHETGEGSIPVLVQLKGDRPVLELIKAEFRRAKVKVEIEQIEDWLLADRLVLLLDGVNEIPNDDLRRSLAQFREDNRTVPMIFATRDLSLGGDLGIGKRLEMKPLSPEQLKEFVGKRLGEKGEQLLGQLRDRLREIAETPLLLKMLCDVFGQTGEIPANKGELFRLFDSDYERIKKEIEYVPVSENFWDFKSEVLQHLAFSMIQTDVQKPTELWLTISKQRAEDILERWFRQREVVDAPTKAKVWLKDLRKYHLLQDAAKPGEIEFHHQLFQEYYAAEHLKIELEQHLEWLQKQSDEPYTYFQHFYLNYLKWTECVAIVISLMDEEETVVDLVEQALDVDLMLGARLAGEVQPCFWGKISMTLSNLFVPKSLYIQILGKTGSDQAILILENLLNEKGMFLHAIDALGEIGSDKSIDILAGILSSCSTHTENIYHYIIEVLGEIPNQSVTDRLKEIATVHPLPLVRESARREMNRIHRLQCYLNCSQHTTKTQSEIDLDTETGALKRQLLKFEIDVFDKKLDELLIDLDFLLDCPNVELRIQIVKALGEIHHDKVLLLLDKAIKDANFNVRVHAVKARARIADPQAIQCLIAAFEQEQISSEYAEYVRSSIIRELGKIGTASLLPFIEGSLQINNTVRFVAVIEAVEKIGDPKSIKFLYDQLSSNEASYQLEIVRTVSVIQSNCKFYNYEIHQAKLRKADRASFEGCGGDRSSLPATITYNVKELTLVSEQQPIFNQYNPTIGVNYAAENSNPRIIQNIQPESQDTALLAIVQIIQTLEKKYTFVQEPQQAIDIIDAEFKSLEASRSPQWQDLLNVKRLYNGGKKAAAKVGEHFAQENVWGKGAVAFLEGISEDLK